MKTLNEILTDLQEYYDRNADAPDLPEGDIFAAIQNLEDAVSRIKTFDWSNHRYEMSIAEQESHNDWRNER